MTAYNVNRSTHRTLTGAASDTVILGRPFPFAEIKNRDAAADLWATVGEVIPVAFADDTYIIRAGESLTVPLLSSSKVNLIAGSGIAYSVTGTA